MLLRHSLGLEAEARAIEAAVSAAIDYRLQSQQLAASAAVHGHAADGVSGAVTNNQAYSDGLWSPLQRQHRPATRIANRRAISRGRWRRSTG